MNKTREIIVTQTFNEMGVQIDLKTTPLVRCKDCMYMHANKNNRQLTCNRRMLGAVRPNDYCSLGEKMDEEEQDHEDETGSDG